jgi:hypothetical protein
MAGRKKPLVEGIEVVYIEIDKLNPAPYNPRKITDEAKDKLLQGIKHFGTVDPLIVRRSDNVIIGGHQRLEAMRILHYQHAPVVYVDLDDAQSKALNILLNNPEAQGHWDQEKLVFLLEDLKLTLPKDESTNIPILEITGFSPGEVNELIDAPEFRPGTLKDQQRLDEKKKVRCPECGHEFTP